MHCSKGAQYLQGTPQPCAVLVLAQLLPDANMQPCRRLWRKHTGVHQKGQLDKVSKHGLVEQNNHQPLI
jgi:hypothetical protein